MSTSSMTTLSACCHRNVRLGSAQNNTRSTAAMTYIKAWEDFEKAAEKLYLQQPSKVRYSMKYVHSKNQLVLKMTDDIVCLQFKTEIAQDVRKIDKFVSNLMRHMASREH